MNQDITRDSITAYDTQNVLGSIEVLQQQCAQAWKAVQQMEFPDSFKSVDRIVFFGMGGSALGIDIVKSVYLEQLRIPVEIVSDYTVPGTVNDNTLVILSSYSGSTEEVVHAGKAILERTKHIVVITTGSDLEQLAQEHQLPIYLIEPSSNPSNQPRMAVGYSVMATLALFDSLGLISISEEEVDAVISLLQSGHQRFGIDAPMDENPVKQLASTVEHRIPVFVASEFLLGSTHTLSNQTNENGKHFCVRYPIPEMNHHLMEGLVFPEEGLTNLHFVFFQSQLYHKRNTIRHTITQQVAEDAGIGTNLITMTGSTKLEQAFELLLFGSYLSFYLSMIHKIDPAPIPKVDYFKAELKKA